MQTGSEEDAHGLSYEMYWAAGRGDDRQRAVDLANYRFGEPDDEDCDGDKRKAEQFLKDEL
jgi:hypothetical protein